MIQKFLCCLFTIIYHRWLWNDFTGEHDTVKHVYGWRTARVITRGGTVRLMQPCFWIFD